jgi:hypothetical protein
MTGDSRPGSPGVTTRPLVRLPAGSALLLMGLVILVAVFWLGVTTRSFLVHVAFPAGFWLTSDGLLVLVGVRPLVDQPIVVLRMLLVGAGLGLVLDFHMVHLTRILDLTAVTTPVLALAMYLGWGLCLPAVYSSYRLARDALGPGRGARVPPQLIPVLGISGLPLALLALFFHLWVGTVPGWFVVPVFTGLWLLAEYVQIRRDRPSLLGALLARDVRPLLAIVLAGLPFVILWEGLDALMGSWQYQHIFWLQPRLLGIPLVAYFGYLSGYYVLFLAVYGAVRPEGEEELPIYGCAR